MDQKLKPDPESPVTSSGRKKNLSTAHGSITMWAMAILIITSIKEILKIYLSVSEGVRPQVCSMFYL